MAQRAVVAYAQCATSTTECDGCGKPRKKLYVLIGRRNFFEESGIHADECIMLCWLCFTTIRLRVEIVEEPKTNGKGGSHAR